MQCGAAPAAWEQDAPGDAAEGSRAHTAAVVLFAVFSFCHLFSRAPFFCLLSLFKVWFRLTVLHHPFLWASKDLLSIAQLLPQLGSAPSAAHGPCMEDVLLSGPFISPPCSKPYRTCSAWCVQCAFAPAVVGRRPELLRRAMSKARS